MDDGEVSTTSHCKGSRALTCQWLSQKRGIFLDIAHVSGSLVKNASLYLVFGGNDMRHF